MKSIYRFVTLFGLLALMLGAAFAAVPAQPALAQDNNPDVPEVQQTVVVPGDDPDVDVIVPDTGDPDVVVQDDDGRGFFVDNWWLLILLGVGLIGLLIGLAARGSSGGDHHHHID